MDRKNDNVEQTYIGSGCWTVEAFDVIGRSRGLYQVRSESAADCLALNEARGLDRYCTREELARYIDKIR